MDGRIVLALYLADELGLRMPQLSATRKRDIRFFAAFIGICLGIGLLIGVPFGLVEPDSALTSEFWWAWLAGNAFLGGVTWVVYRWNKDGRGDARILFVIPAYVWLVCLGMTLGTLTALI